MSDSRPVIGFIPQDTRPVSCAQTILLAESAGYRVLAPPFDLLGGKRVAGNAPLIGEWLIKHFREAAGWVVSLDMLAYGGLVPSRNLDVSAEEAISRLECLSAARSRVHPGVWASPRDSAPAAGPEPIFVGAASGNALAPASASDFLSDLSDGVSRIPVFAWQSIRRLSTTVLSSDDLAKWETFHHRQALPADFRDRNHRVNLQTLELCRRGIIDVTLLLQEDARGGGGQKVEHEALAAFMSAHSLGERAVLTCGTDEGAAVLLARLISRLAGKMGLEHLRPSGENGPPPHPCGLGRVLVTFSSPAGAERVALYEDRPLRESVFGQIRASGLELVSDSAAFELMVWCPDRPQRDLVFEAPHPSPDVEMNKFLQSVQERLQKGRWVVIADLAYANGADSALCAAMAGAFDLSLLTGYSAWNTAANALGHALAQGMLSLKNKRFLYLRFLEDWGYQAEIRSRLVAFLQQEHRADIWDIPEPLRELSQRSLQEEMRAWHQTHLARHFPAERFPSCSFPWQRTFEIDAHWA